MKLTPQQKPQPPRLPKHLGVGAFEILDDVECSLLAVSGCDFTGQAAAHVLLDQVHLRRVVLNRTRLVKPFLTDARVEASDLSGAVWEKARFRRVEFIGCRLLGIQLLEARLEDVLFQACNLEGATLASAAFQVVRFEKCAMRDVALEEAELTGVAFRQCDLTQADLRGAALRGADLRGSSLNGLQVSAKDLLGAIVDSTQAIQIAGLLGVTVKDVDE